jgi:hypothetical protein
MKLIEAQRAAVAGYLNGGNWSIVAGFRTMDPVRERSCLS